MNKKLFAPITSLVLLSTLSVGVTYALFTSNASSAVNINAGTVKVDYSSTLDLAESRYEDNDAFDAKLAAQGTDFDAIFENGGTAKIENADSTTITLDRLAPMDKVVLTTKAKKKYTDIVFNDGDFIVFGPERRGLPAEYVTRDTAITIPMREGQRSLNLSNSVAITLYEVIRQIGL